MAASGSTTIQLYSTSTASAIPLAGNLVQGELGVNVTDKKIYTKNGSGTVVTVGFGPDASVSLTALTGLTVVSGGASISGNVSVSGTGSFTSAVNVVTVNTTSGSGAVGLIQGQRSGVTKGYVGIDTSDNFGLFDNAGTMRAGVSSTGLAVTSDSVNGGQLTIMGATNQNYQIRVGFDTTNLLGKIQAIHVGTAYKDLVLQPYGGNLGLGVTPSAWSSSYKALQVSGFGLMADPNGNTYQLANAYFDGAYRYFNSSHALKYEMTLGSYTWSIAPSGTAGNAISWTQAMAIDASGNLLVGTSSAGANEKFNVTGSVANNIVRVINTNAAPYGIFLSYSQNITGTGNEFIDCRTNASTQVFRVMANGNVANANNSYGAISDIKLKQDITDATPKLAKLLKVRIVNYKFKSDPNGIKQIGVIAQELEEISPGLVEEAPDYEEVTLTREVEKTIAVTVKKEVMTERVLLEVIDGVAVQKVIKEVATVDEAVVDEYPVFDGDGNPVMEVVTPATEAELSQDGTEVKAASPAVLRQKTHTVPRMETVVEKEEYTERRPTGTTTKSVKYSVFVPMLIKAMQEQQAQIEELKARVGA